MSALTDVTTGICYTWSGDKKKYESDLFSAELFIFSTEYCYRHDSADSSTLVFGKVENDSAVADTWSTYLPYGDISIIHNIQDNGEDHYTFTGTYTKPENWSPPAGVDGPFDYTVNLEYPYYQYTYGWAGHITAWYNGKFNWLDLPSGGSTGLGYYYGKKK